MLLWKTLLVSRQGAAFRNAPRLHQQFFATSTRRALSTTPIIDDDDDDDDSDEADDERTKSIAEAIAAYKAEESLRMADKLEQARKEGEQAAMARAEQDLILAQRRKAFEEWQRNLELAKQQQQQQQEQQQREQEEATAAKVEKSTEASEGPVHPVLGAVLADLGYKRLHVVPSSVLENIPVWEKQRIFRYDRSKTMAADKTKTLHLGLPGVICLFEDSKGQLSVLDG